LLGRGHEDRRLEHIGERGAGGRQRGAEVGHGQAGLRPDVADADDLAVIVQRAGSGGEDQRTGRGGGGVRVGHPSVQAVTVARERLGTDVDEVPGGHLAALSRPAELAGQLTRYL
jgi:hypothetical protein